MADNDSIIREALSFKDADGNIKTLYPRTTYTQVIGYENFIMGGRCDDHTITLTNGKGNSVVLELSNEVISSEEIEKVFASIWGYNIRTEETELIDYYSQKVINGDITIDKVPLRIRVEVQEKVDESVVEYANKVIKGTITIDEVPAGIRQAVIEYIEDQEGDG